MNKDILNRYFEKQCSVEEVKIVEAWLLDPNNRTEFDLFLEERWDSHYYQRQEAPIVAIKKSMPMQLWKAATAAVVLIALGFYFFSISQSPVVESSSAIVRHSGVSSDSSPAHLSLSDTAPVVTNPKNFKQHEKKPTKIHKSNQTVAALDTSAQKRGTKTVKATKLGNFMVNEVLLSQLRHKIDSNQLVLNIDLHEATLAEIAYRLRKNYGIILEPCSTGTSSKTYTARFEKISINDLLHDMSQKMLFSYTVKDSIIKVCFN
ncbi:hypothetical protein [Sphingobacterium tabacisoli]|uniref:Protein FecR C-terminal domain-containing protein n=1 Tax=Sphingobacterium tabacisoli TaxID=2044855 RepID=A0ABW5L896_9SPHI|nr:hypothetical protein [Sphingobacterium tabacisoli]